MAKIDERDKVRPTLSIPIPYEGGPLELDPSSVGFKKTYLETFEFLAGEATNEEIPRILTSAVLLWWAGAGDMEACLDTAVVWERG